MRKILALLLILLLPGLLLAKTMTTSPSHPLALTHVTVIDVTSGRAKSEMTVMIEGEHIIALGRGSKINEKKATALFARFVRNGTWICPTLTVLRAAVFSGDADFRDDPRIKYIPDFLKQQFWEGAYGWK